MFGSVAVLVTISCTSSFTVCGATTPGTGAIFTSFTVTWKLLVAVNTGFTMSDGSLFVTTIVTILVLGLWFWVGVQVNTPLVVMFIPDSGATIAYPVIV